MTLDTDKLLHDTITDLFKLAARDGVITDSEPNIINQVEIDIQRYCDVLDLAQKDSIVNQEEHQILDEMAKNILDNAEKTALADGIYSRNEKDLLVKLNKIVHRYF